MRRKILASAILLFVFFSGIVTAGAVNGTYDGFSIIRIFSGGKELKPDKVPAINYKGNTLVPIGVLRDLGVKVEWNGSQQRVDVSLPVKTVPILTAEQLQSLSKYAHKVTTGPTEGHPNGELGSAFIIDGYMLTNAHVAADAAYAQVEIDGKLHKVTKYDFVNADADIMGFGVTGGNSLPYSTELPSVGDPIYCIGFPGGKLTVTQGEVNFIIPVGSVHKIAHSARIDGGASGSILLNGRGEIIGMNEGTTDDSGTYHAWAIPTQYLLDEIRKAKG